MQLGILRICRSSSLRRLSLVSECDGGRGELTNVAEKERVHRDVPSSTELVKRGRVPPCASPIRHVPSLEEHVQSW